MATEAQIIQAIDTWTQARQILNTLRSERQLKQSQRDDIVTRISDLAPLINNAQSAVDIAQQQLKALL